MEKNLSSLSLEDLVALEKMLSCVCRKYENIAQINRFSKQPILANEYTKASNTLSHYNNKRDEVLDEMEKRITQLV